MSLARLLAVVTVTMISAAAFGLGSDHRGSVGGMESWPKGLVDLANDVHRVHGFFVNDEDVFFYSGDSDAANAFLVACAALPKTDVRVVLHGGTGEVRSPWDKQARKDKADWQLATVGRMRGGGKGKVPEKYQITVDIYVGGRVELAKLKVPATLEVSAGEDAGEAKDAIGKFVDEHKKGRAAATRKEGTQ